MLSMPTSTLSEVKLRSDVDMMRTSRSNTISRLGLGLRFRAPGSGQFLVGLRLVFRRIAHRSLGSWIDKSLGSWIDKSLGSWTDRSLGSWTDRSLGSWIDKSLGSWSVI